MKNELFKKYDTNLKINTNLGIRLPAMFKQVKLVNVCKPSISNKQNDSYLSRRHQNIKFYVNHKYEPDSKALRLDSHQS